VFVGTSAAVLAAAVTTCSSRAHAQPRGDPYDALAAVHDAWEAGDFDKVPSLCHRAIDKGGLARADLVDAYVHLGAALSIEKKKTPALAAFRRAAFVDPSFVVPPEAGKTAAALAEAARRAQKKVGSLSLAVVAPDRIEAGDWINVDVTLTPSRGTGVTTLSLETRDALSARSDKQRMAATAQAHFDVAPKMALPDASLLLHVRALDAHDNEVGEAERRVHVAPIEAAPPPAPVAILGPTPPARGSTGASRASREQDDHGSSGGFWSSPWPYVIGGTVLAAGGAATWYLTRPTDNVDVGSVRVQLR
jgi:hypothetical protein